MLIMQLKTLKCITEINDVTVRVFFSDLHFFH